MSMLYLAHHGVKGMKWGVRKGPPYPLGSGGKSNPFNVSLSSISKTSIDLGKQICKGRLEYDSDVLHEYAVKNPNAYAVFQEWYDEDSDRLTNKPAKKDFDESPAGAFMRSDTQEVAEDLVNKAIESAAKDEQAAKRLGEAVVHDFLSPAYEANVPKLDHEETSDESMAAINPNYGQYGYTENCTGCSMAFTLRKQGYDVTAGAFDTAKGTTDNGVREFFVDAPKFSNPAQAIDDAIHSASTPEDKKRAAAEALENSILADNPNGSYGILNASHTDVNYGHSIAYEVNDGHVTYYDNQVNKRYDDTRDMVEDEGFIYDSCRFLRTDDLKPNWSRMARYDRIAR